MDIDRATETPKDYDRPVVTDYGTLLEVTAACLGGSNGDYLAPTGLFGGLGVGTKTSFCTSTK